MKNRVEFLVKNSQDTGRKGIDKDFSAILRQYNDYKKVTKQYYRWGGSSLLILFILGMTFNLRKDSNLKLQQATFNDANILTSEVKMGPFPTGLVSFPEFFEPDNIIDASEEASEINRKKRDIEEVEKVEENEIVAVNNEKKETTQNTEKPLFRNSLAEPIAGFQNLYEYFHTNITYPEEMVADSVQGVVKISFTVNADSTLSNLKVLQSLGLELDTEAIRLVESMPGWKPALKNGEAISSTFVIPVRFNINDHD